MPEKIKNWIVKCPRCRKQWEFKTPGYVHVAPQYKYCESCKKIMQSFGTQVYRGRKNHLDS